jgi:uncharacterized protein YbjT (DUF2867 family)
MPVVVTGASGFVGRRAVAGFTRTSPEVRCYVRDPRSSDELRRLGSKVAVGPIADVDTLATVMHEAHTVCHLVGRLDLPDEAAYLRTNHESTRAVLEAASRAGVRRVLFLSYPGASPGASNAFLRAKGLAERDVATSGLEHVILRSTHVYGPGSPWLRATLGWSRRTPALVVGAGAQVLAPVHIDDVAAVLVAADDRDRLVSGTWGLEGPDRITADGMCDLLAGRRRRKLHVGPGPAARLAMAGPGRPSGVALGVLAMDSLADAPDGAVEFGVVRRTSLRDGVRRALRDGPIPPGPGFGPA